VLEGTGNSELITGASGQDILFGDGGDDTLLGDNGAGAQPNQDKLYGGSGNDTLNGQERDDDLYGGAGSDTFVFNTALTTSGNSNVDQVKDFQADGTDKILLDDDIFTKFSVASNTVLPSNNFAANSGGNAVDGNDYIIFDTATGNLYYDADGSLSGSKVLFATLTVVSGTVDAGDFVVAP
jgi:serralysin